jgi:hypothetical protein
MLLDSVQNYQRPFTLACAKLWEYLQMPDDVARKGPIDPNISVKEHIDGWNKQKARTASVRAALSFSNHKAAAQHPGMAKIDTLFRHSFPTYSLQERLLSGSVQINHGFSDPEEIWDL